MDLSSGGGKRLWKAAGSLSRAECSLSAMEALLPITMTDVEGLGVVVVVAVVVVGYEGQRARRDCYCR